MELAVHGLLGVFTDQHAALRELPALAAGAAGKQQLAVTVREDDADVSAKSLCVYPVVAHRNRYKIFNWL